MSRQGSGELNIPTKKFAWGNWVQETISGALSQLSYLLDLEEHISDYGKILKSSYRAKWGGGGGGGGGQDAM